MKYILFWDLDGTIINSFERQYKLFCELCPSNKLSFDEYWKIKKEGVKQQYLLHNYFNYTASEIYQFKQAWITEIENYQRLFDDKLVDGVYEVLKSLNQHYFMYVLTNRLYYKRAEEQISRFKIDKFFKEILVTQQKVSKINLMLRTTSVHEKSNCFFVSDTIDDIIAANLIGVNSVAVTWGVQEKQLLLKSNPSYVCENISSLWSVFYE